MKGPVAPRILSASLPRTRRRIALRPATVCLTLLAVAGSLLWVGTASAATTAAGRAVEATAGSNQIHINAADAIQATCGGLVNAQTRSQQQADLLNNCRGMVGSTVRGLGSEEEPNRLNEFGLTSSRDVFNALLQFSGEETSSQGRLATETSNRQFANLGARMSAIRHGAGSGSSLTLNVLGTDILNHDQVAGANNTTPLTGGSAGEAGGAGGWGWFLTGDVGFGDRDETSNEDGYDYDSYSFTLGIDYAWNNGWAAGGAVGYNDYQVDFDNASAAVSQVSGGSIESDGYTVAAFAMYAGEPLYFSGIISYGSLDYDLERRVQFTSGGIGSSPDRTLNGSTDSDQFGGQATVGTVLGTGATTFDLYAAIDFLSIEVDGFTEEETLPTGGLALAFDDQEIDSVQSVLGGVVRWTINTDNAVVVPYFGAEYRHEFDNDARVVDARYAFGVPGSNPSFQTPTDDPDEDFVELTLGISAQLRNNVFLFLQWDRTVALEDTEANLISAGIRGTF